MKNVFLFLAFNIFLCSNVFSSEQIDFKPKNRSLLSGFARIVSDQEIKKNLQERNLDQSGKISQCNSCEFKCSSDLLCQIHLNKNQCEAFYRYNFYRLLELEAKRLEALAAKLSEDLSSDDESEILNFDKQVYQSDLFKGSEILNLKK